MRERKKASVSRKLKAFVLTLALVAGTVTSIGNVFAAATAGNFELTAKVSDGYTFGDGNANISISFRKANHDAAVGGNFNKQLSATTTTTSQSGAIPNDTTEVFVQVQDAGKGLKTASVKFGDTEMITEQNKADLDTGITFQIANVSTTAITMNFEIGVASSEQEYTWDPNDPTIWFVWGTEGEENSFFKYQITGIPTDKSMKEVEVADVKDGTTQFDLSKQERVTPDGPEKAYEFVYSSAMTHALADVNFTNASTSEKFRYLRDHRMTVDPVGSSPASANAIHCAGAYAFNVLILNKDEYKPIEVVSGGEKYKSEYDSELIQSGIYDLGGTSQANPGKFETFLLEDTVKIKGSAQMGQITNISIMGVSNNAVTATSVDGVWTIKFNSNYYDEVTMEIDLQNGEKGYVTIIRKDVAIKEFWPGSTAPASMKNKSYVEFCYPSTDSYKNYKVVLTCVASDGSKVTHTLDTPNKGLEMGNGDYYDGYELPPDGTHVVGVKKAWYALPDGVTASAYSNIYVNVVKNLENEATSFGGTLLGHGLGLEFKSNGHGFDRVLSNGQVIR